MAPPSPETATDRLRRELAKVASFSFTADSREMGRLRQPVHDVVDALKTAGLPPEHVVRCLKRLVQEAKIGPSLLSDTIVKWAVERYFID
jgi:hypothetical protein